MTMTRGRKSCTHNQRFTASNTKQNAFWVFERRDRASLHLHDFGGEAVVEPHPVTRWDDTDARHATEDGHPYLPPVVVEVIGVDLSAEDGQDQRQDGQQVDLTPELRDSFSTISIYSQFHLFCVYLQRWHSQRYSRRRRRCRARSSPGCPQRCRRSPAPASGGSSSPSSGTRTGDSPQNTACTPGTGGHTVSAGTGTRVGSRTSWIEGTGGGRLNKTTQSHWFVRSLQLLNNLRQTHKHRLCTEQFISCLERLCGSKVDTLDYPQWCNTQLTHLQLGWTERTCRETWTWYGSMFTTVQTSENTQRSLHDNIICWTFIHP